MSMVSCMVFGWLLGILTMAVAVLIAINCCDKISANEKFVKALVEKEGWTNARWELETAFKGKYMRTWRRLYKESIKKGENKNEQ